jgi:hypothetical protein
MIGEDERPRRSEERKEIVDLDELVCRDGCCIYPRLGDCGHETAGNGPGGLFAARGTSERPPGTLLGAHKFRTTAITDFLCCFA